MADIADVVKGDPVTVMVLDHGWAKAKYLRRLDGVVDAYGEQMHLVSLLQIAGDLEKFTLLTVSEDTIRRGFGL